MLSFNSKQFLSVFFVSGNVLNVRASTIRKENVETKIQAEMAVTKSFSIDLMKFSISVELILIKWTVHTSQGTSCIMYSFDSVRELSKSYFTSAHKLHLKLLETFPFVTFTKTQFIRSLKIDHFTQIFSISFEF